MKVLILSHDEVRSLLDPEALLGALAKGFELLSTGAVSIPPRIVATVPDAGLLAAMPGHAPGLALGVKLVSVFPRNLERSLPSHQALVCAFDPATGSPVAVMDGTYITAIRTAGAAALSTRLLARRSARVLAILGAGVQGASHLRMLPLVREFAEIRVASRQLAHAERLAAAHPRARAVQTFESAARGADVVALCTHSGEPILDLAWLSPGVHVTSVGFAPPHGELTRAAIERGSLYVETRAAFEPPPVGCYELVGVDPARGTELGEVLLGRRPGRQSDEEITVYKSMGHAVEDLAATAVVLEKARAEGAGRVIDL